MKRRFAGFRRRSILPGFGLTLGFTLFYLSLIVLIPISATFVETSKLGWHQFWHVITTQRAMASYWLTFGASLIGAGVNFFVGTLVAWVLVRYRFAGKRILDSLVDLPFALPTAVAGIALTTLYAQNGWFGKPLAQI
ncbi:MAG TPA: sulfate ABC transporter permease subunit CysT, partial [Candidatus Nitrosotalea sp.]|nr:sulfate ABC transporter permease subunit CysT [Candidatus Nitrosotalea sp.]